jgi:hypothetical protein
LRRPLFAKTFLSDELAAGHDRKAILRPPLVRTVLENRFAKPSAGDGFGEPIGRESEHDAPFASSAE